MLKLVVLAALLAFAAASPGLVDSLVGGLSQTVGDLGKTVGNTVNNVLGVGQKVQLNILQLAQYFETVLGVRRVRNAVGVEFCTCPNVINPPFVYYQPQARTVGVV